MEREQSDAAGGRGGGGGGFFPMTRWTLVAAARAGADEAGAEEARRALGELCEAYWKPLYAFARQSGRSAAEAEDSVQSFLLRMIAKDSFSAVDPAKGRLRSFLAASFKKHLASEWRRESAQKRGGGEPALSIDAGLAEEQFLADAGRGLDPQALFDRRWALTVLDRVMVKLGQAFEARGQRERFEALQPFLEPGAAEEGYAAVGRKLGLAENAVQQAVFRMRREYRKLLEEEIADTVADASEVQGELRHLIAAVGG